MVKRNKGFLDALIILLNIAVGRGNILGNWLLFTDNSFIFPIIVIIIDIIYVILRSKRPSLSLFHHVMSKLPWFIYVVLLSYNFINIFFQVGGLDLPSFEYGMVVFFIFIILNKQASSKRIGMLNLKDRVHYLSRGYIWLSMVSIIGVFSSFVLYIMGLVGDVPISADFLSANEENGAIYSRVFMSVRYYHIGIFDDFVRVPFFQDNGIFCGIFHEPNFIAYNVFPCFILLLGLYYKLRVRYLIILSSILMMLFAGSATNVLVVLICLSLFFLIVKGRDNIWSMILGISVVFLAILLFISIDDTFFMFVIDRLDDSNASNESTQELLEYTFSPKSLFGFNFLSTEFRKYGAKSGDIGFIVFLLNVVFLFLYLRNTIKLIFKKESISVAVGFASLYCILHSAKMGMTMFAQILPVFLIFLQSYILTSNGRVNIANPQLTYQ